MTRRILLHVGAPKCGSTFLQRSLIQSQCDLRAAGIDYPHPGVGHPGNAADLAGIDAAGCDAMFGSGIHTVVLSHEDLLFAPQRGAALVGLADKAGIDLQVLAFLRPFSEFMFGIYSQQMKQKFERYLLARMAYDGLDFEDFCTQAANGLAQRSVAGLTAWIARVGRERFTLSSHRQLRDVVTQTLAAPAGTINWQVPHYLSNPSLRVEDCEALAHAIADTDMTEDALRTQFKQIFHQVRDPDSGRTEDRVRWLEGLFTQTNREIAELLDFDNRLKSGTSRTHSEV